MFNREDYDYYEDDSLAKEIFDEACDKLKDAIKGEIKCTIDSIKRREESLVKAKERLSSDRLALSKRERELIEKERKIMLKEKDFYGTQFGKLKNTILSNYFEKLYMISSRSNEKDKCGLCDNNRDVIAKRPDKTEIKVRCNCAGYIQEYYAESIPWMDMTIRTDKENLSFSTSLRFCRGEEERAEYLPKDNLIKKFEEIPEKIKENKQTWNVLFTDKDEAEKYINYLNSK